MWIQSPIFIHFPKEIKGHIICQSRVYAQKFGYEAFNGITSALIATVGSNGKPAYPYSSVPMVMKF